MMHTLATGLAILHLGPGLAFALPAVGCEGQEPLLGGICGGNQLVTFAVTTVLTWLVLTALAWALALRRRDRMAASATEGLP